MHLLAGKDDVSQICLLMKQDYEALGFLSITAVEEHIDDGQVILQREGREIYGYLMYGPIRPGRTVVIKQAMVDMDARRLGSGKVAFWELVDRAQRGMAVRIRLRCAEDLPSNYFWLALGCRRIATIDPHNTRKRKLHVYEFNLTDTFLAPSDIGKLWTPREGDAP